MARLLGTNVADVQSDRVGCARGAAGEWGVIIVLKGAGTVVATPDGEVRVNATGNPGMATGGMGDVLTGLIASLIGQGATPFDAASAGAYLHGLSADLVASMDGMIGMTAGDVIRHLPLAMRKPSTGR
jgi:NAD(P)H-hydrate epimerase